MGYVLERDDDVYCYFLNFTFFRDGMMNDYEEAIKSIGTTIGEYSTSKEFP